MEYPQALLEILSGSEEGKRLVEAAGESAARGLSAETVNRMRQEAGVTPLFKEDHTVRDHHPINPDHEHSTLWNRDGKA
jgi:hypothetical protein